MYIISDRQRIARAISGHPPRISTGEAVRGIGEEGLGNGDDGGMAREDEEKKTGFSPRREGQKEGGDVRFIFWLIKHFHLPDEPAGVMLLRISSHKIREHH
jgi:hypothetical protein